MVRVCCVMAKVLLVDDDEAVRTMLGEAIELAGHEVRCVRGCSEAAAALAEASYGLLITDARLPDGSGRALAEQAAQRGLGAVLVSGHPDELEPSASRGVLSLQKPFRVEELLVAITRSLGT
jgi:two-component system, NtrC family, nitrogen regulation response regulator GlnG